MKNTALRAYMAFERHGGPMEGAVLVFAYTARHARNLAGRCVMNLTGCRFVDVEATRLKSDAAHLRVSDEPHIIDDPISCKRCEMWYAEPLDENGLCDWCVDL